MARGTVSVVCSIVLSKVASHSSETLRELPRDTKKITDHKREDVSYIYTSEIPTEFARENISSLHVKITCSVYT